MAAVARVFRGCRFLMSPAAAGGTKRPMAAAAGAKADPPKPERGIMKPLPISDTLSRFVGAKEISRSAVTKLIWDHIKANHLQNPAKKSEIILDEKLKTIFGNRDKIGMLEIAKLLNPHFIKK